MYIYNQYLYRYNQISMKSDNILLSFTIVKMTASAVEMAAAIFIIHSLYFLSGDVTGNRRVTWLTKQGWLGHPGENIPPPPVLPINIHQCFVVWEKWVPYMLSTKTFSINIKCNGVIQNILIYLLHFLHRKYVIDSQIHHHTRHIGINNSMYPQYQLNVHHPMCFQHQVIEWYVHHLTLLTVRFHLQSNVRAEE